MSSRSPLAHTGGDRFGRIVGSGAYRPSRVVPNSELVEAIDSSDEWIQQRSGIRTRHFAAPDETVVDMAEHASRQALEHAGIEASDLDTVIVATVTHMLQTPAAAPILADRLGAATAAAFDISAACAGFCHGLAIGNDLIRAGTSSTVLVVGVEKLSGMTDPNDRGTAFIFGDGAGAAVLAPSPTPGIGPTVWGSDGARAETITQTPNWDELRDKRFDADQPWPTLRMDGQPVFRWAVFSMAPVARRAVEAAGLSIDEIDVFVPHQANMRIIDAMIKQLHLPEHIPVARDIAETGNTSAASIPIAIRRLLDEGQATTGDRALLIGFGAGLVYAAQVVELP
ncbi:MAG: beta-ketoacyl-ACP synthase III [Actinomycetales bacterium]